MKKYGIAIGLAAVILVCVCVFVLASPSGVYYSQIDNDKLEAGEPRNGVVDFSGGMAYSYTLLSYNEKGKEKEITFGASRELKEGAFICLTVQPLRGVTAWEEVQYNELPPAVQSHYEAPEE